MTNNIYLRGVESLRAALHREGMDIDRESLERDLGQPLREADVEQLRAIGATLWHVYAAILNAENRLPHPSLRPPALPAGTTAVPDDVRSLTGPVS